MLITIERRASLIVPYNTQAGAEQTGGQTDR